MGKLTDTTIKNFKPLPQAKKLTDGGGLYLYVLPSGGKSWRIDYAFERVRKTLTLGLYPSVTLMQARRELAEVKIKIKAGIDPQAEKMAVKQAVIEEIENSFESVALDWIQKKQNDRTEKHRRDIVSKLERFIYPYLKNRNVTSITAKELLDVLRKIEAKGLYETTKKVLGICNQIFSFAIGEGKVEINICSGLTKQLMTVKRKNFAFITEKRLLGKLLKDIDGYPHNILTKTARPSELINAKWSEFDFEENLWVIPEERMKLRRKHLVPLCASVAKLLKGLYEITGETEYLFANWNNKNKPITIDGLRQGLRRLGYDAETITPHGFRHTASTMLNELGYNRDHIEKQLAHSTGNTVRGTYNHAEYLQERRKMVEEWAEFLEDLKRKAYPIKRIVQ